MRPRRAGRAAGRAAAVLFACLLLTAPLTGPAAARDGAQGAEQREAPLRLEALGAGVWAALQPPALRFADCNSAVIDLGDPQAPPGAPSANAGVLVVDTQASGATVRWLIGEIRRLEREKKLSGPVRFVVNTHWHSDHTQGNHLYREAFGDSVVFIGHGTLREDVPERAAPYLAGEIERVGAMLPKAEEQLAKGLGLAGQTLDEEQRIRQRQAIDDARERLGEWKETRFLPPGLTYADRLDLRFGEGRTVRIFHLAGHTRGDTVVFLPDDKILVTGDLVDEVPYGGHGFPRQWSEALERLEALDFEVAIPGHGDLMRSKAPLRRARAFLDSVVEQVEAGLARSLSLEEIQKEIGGDRKGFLERALTGALENAEESGLDPAQQRNFDAFLPETVARAHEELTSASEP